MLLLSLLSGYFSVMSPGAEPRVPSREVQEAGLGLKALKELNLAMEKEVREEQVSGLIGLIGWKGKIGYFESHGQRDLDKEEPMSKDSLLRI